MEATGIEKGYYQGIGKGSGEEFIHYTTNEYFVINVEIKEYN